MYRALGLCALVGAAAIGVASFSAPVATAAFMLGGEHLDLAQRDFRVVNSFSDREANDNTVAQAQFPGTLGAPLAIRKAHAEWSSGAWAGTGLGDGAASNPVLGSGGANFDNSWQGVAASGGTNDNVHIALPTSSGGISSFVETPVSDGWRIVYYDNGIVWGDGPGDPGPGVLDLQGQATHEIGHVLGLGHSSVAGATMNPALPGNGVALRSIEADDIAGLQAIYGVKSASKPGISALQGSADVGGTLRIVGLNFAATGNEVWFTAAAASGEPLKLAGVASTAGGTRIEITLPTGIADGEILVRTSGADSGAVLSNAFPFDLAEGFTEIHPGFAPAGPPPWLTAVGDITPGGEGFSLLLGSAAPSAPGALFVALAQGAAAFKGGTLYAVPVLLTLPISVNGAGSFAVTASLPASVPPGTVLVLQAALDAGPVQLSNGLRLDIP
jgi:hypothetical protein